MRTSTFVYNNVWNTWSLAAYGVYTYAWMCIVLLRWQLRIWTVPGVASRFMEHHWVYCGLYSTSLCLEPKARDFRILGPKEYIAFEW
jgi:hypothetical protein